MNRRSFIAAACGLATAGLAPARPGAAAELAGVTDASIRGSLDAEGFGIRPGAHDDQSRAFARMLEEAAKDGQAVFLPPGRYRVSNITLPRNVRLTGIPGSTRIVYGGEGHLMLAEGAEHIELSGLVLDGANRRLMDHVQSILDMRDVRRLVVDNCEIVGSAKNGIALEKTGGRIERTRVSGAGEAGIYSVSARVMRIAANEVVDCANGGILVHRWQAGEDGTIVTGNRVERIAARNGGTGQFGNGINVFRAGNVTVTDNQVADCAFSAIRANSAGNVQIGSNTCLRSGETAIYSEFAFEGAAITSNIVDGAASGISMVNFNEGGRLGTCTGNVVRNMSREGPYEPDAPGFGSGISVEADTTVTGNVIENAPLYGLGIGWGPFMRNVVASDNVIRTAGTGIAVSVVEGGGSAVITGNIVEDVRNGAIVGHRWAEPVTEDMAASGNGGYSHLTVERNQVA